MALTSLFPEHFTLTVKCFCSPTFVVQQMECLGVSDFKYREAGGKWDAAGEDPSSESTHDNNHLKTDRIKGHSSSGGAVFCYLMNSNIQLLRHFSLQDQQLFKTNLF